MGLFDVNKEEQEKVDAKFQAMREGRKRTRNEILDDMGGLFGNFQQNIIIELLLDIRDSLEKE